MGIFFITIPVYLFVRYISNSHWSGGDYSYSLEKLPFNVAGNIIGYFLVIVFGLPGMNIAQNLRSNFREDIFLTALIGIAVLAGIMVGGFYLWKKKRYSKEVLFGLLF